MKGAFASITKVVAAAKVTATRPNNVTAYSGAALQVYGAAADARLSLAVPAIPADSLQDIFTGLSLWLVQSRDPTQAALNIFVYLFNGAPATVQGDQATLALSDADLAIQLTGTGAQFTLPTGAGSTGSLNQSAAGAGRRGVVANMGAPVTNVKPATIGCYLCLNAAYTPVANETIDVYPFWKYAARVP